MHWRLQQYEILVQWTLSKRVFRRVAADAHQLPPLFDDAHTPCLPWRSNLLCTVRKIAIFFGTGSVFETLAWANTKGQALESYVTRLTAPEAD